MLKLISTGVIPDSLFVTGIKIDPDLVGIGAFGRVFRGEYNGQEVALKLVDKARKNVRWSLFYPHRNAEFFW
jgi:hypothetical protein